MLKSVLKFSNEFLRYSFNDTKQSISRKLPKPVRIIKYNRLLVRESSKIKIWIIKTRNDVSEYQDFKIFWGNRPPALPPPRTVARPFIRLLLKKHDFIFLNGRTEVCFNIVLSKNP